MTGPRGGRPPVPPDERRESVHIRLPAWLLRRWRKTGPGWQTRLAHILETIERARLPQRKELDQ
jgi:uncharacterized protein (DUF4415 family)